MYDPNETYVGQAPHYTHTVLKHIWVISPVSAAPQIILRVGWAELALLKMYNMKL